MRFPRAFSLSCSSLLGITALSFSCLSSAALLTIPGTTNTGLASGFSVTAGSDYVLNPTGTVDLSPLDGGYQVNPFGYILTAPTPGSFAFGWYMFNTSPIGSAPTIGQQRSADYGKPLGGILYGYSANTSLMEYIGDGGVIHATQSGELFFSLAELGTANDNVGSYQLDIQPYNNGGIHGSSVPVPGGAMLVGLGLNVLGWGRWRKSQKA